jgi:GGDEF domain-containing protein
MAPENTQQSRMHPLLERQMVIAQMFEYVATHDALTGLLNKEAWKSDIEDRINEGQAFGIVFMDMNSFKRINDEHGHDRGDQVLRAFGAFMTSRFNRTGDTLSHERSFFDPESPESVSHSNTLSRWAGDEFGFTFSLSADSRRGIDPRTGEQLTVADRVARESDYLKSVIAEFVAAQPDDIKALDFDISIGSAFWDPENPVSGEQLFNDVDEAMFDHKEAIKERRRLEAIADLDEETYRRSLVANAAIDATGLSRDEFWRLFGTGARI